MKSLLVNNIQGNLTNIPTGTYECNGWNERREDVSVAQSDGVSKIMYTNNPSPASSVNIGSFFDFSQENGLHITLERDHIRRFETKKVTVNAIEARVEKTEITGGLPELSAVSLLKIARDTRKIKRVVKKSQRVS